MRHASSLVGCFVLACVFGAGCVFGVDLDEKPCPCAPGFECDTDRNVCVASTARDGGAADTGTSPRDGGGDAGARDGGGLDGGGMDAGADNDAGGTDAGGTDAGMDDDAGLTPDAGPMGWVAYNDLGWRTGQLATRITTITSPNGTHGTLVSSGELIDHATGAGTGVTLTVTGGSLDWSGDVPSAACDASTGASTCRTAAAAPGTDADDVFGGIVDTFGTMGYDDTVNTVLTLTGLSPSERYEVVLFADRGYYGWTRTTTVTLGGAASFQNESSTAVDDLGEPIFTSPTDPVTRLPTQNPSGLVARFTAIAPTSGTLTLTLTTVDTMGRGKYANAIRVSQLP